MMLTLAVWAAPLHAQATPQVLVDALKARLGGLGGCWGTPDTSSVWFTSFPKVSFLRGECLFEHGDRGSAVVGTDSTGTVFLLGDRLGLRYLLERHPPAEPTQEEMATFAWELLELRGDITAYSARVVERKRLPLAVQDSLRGVPEQALKSWCDSKRCGATMLVTTPGYHWEGMQYFSVDVLAPTIVIIHDTTVWAGREVNRFILPRTGEDSALARVAGASYGEAFADAILEQRDGLARLLDLTPRLNGAPAETHTHVLYDMLSTWGDERFAGELARRPLGVQFAVVSGMTKVAGPEPWQYAPCMAKLAATLEGKR